jgi:hypothetical protein
MLLHLDAGIRPPDALLPGSRRRRQDALPLCRRFRIFVYLPTRIAVTLELMKHKCKW